MSSGHPARFLLALLFLAGSGFLAFCAMDALRTASTQRIEEISGRLTESRHAWHMSGRHASSRVLMKIEGYSPWFAFAPTSKLEPEAALKALPAQAYVTMKLAPEEAANARTWNRYAADANEGQAAALQRHYAAAADHRRVEVLGFSANGRTIANPADTINDAHKTAVLLGVLAAAMAALALLATRMKQPTQ